MKFCKFCDNMMYVDVEQNINLLYYCKNCNNREVKKKEDQDKSICVIDDDKLTDDIKYNQYVNEYIEYNNTLPRVNNIICLNEECTKPNDKDNEVIYIKYDFTSMKYMYYCCYCKKFWRN